MAVRGSPWSACALRHKRAKLGLAGVLENSIRFMNNTDHYSFACGDFQQTAIQERIFGRQLTGMPDALIGFSREPFVRRTGNEANRVDGMVFRVTNADLATADAYEPPNYRRSRVQTASGLLAWVYLRQI
jgi:hypothetical protein